MTPRRPHGEDLLDQVPPSGQRTPGVFILRSHSQTVEPGEQRTGQNPHRTSGTGGWPRYRLFVCLLKHTGVNEANCPFYKSLSFLLLRLSCLLLWIVFRSLAWPGAQMVSSWPQCAKTGKFASMIPASPLHLCRYVQHIGKYGKMQLKKDELCLFILTLRFH